MAANDEPIDFDDEESTTPKDTNVAAPAFPALFGGVPFGQTLTEGVASISRDMEDLNRFCIRLDFSDTNGILEVGIAAGVDPSIADESKVPVIAGRTGARATYAAIWAHQKFSNNRVLAPYYTAAAYMVVRAGFVSRNDGDSRYVPTPPIVDPTPEIKASLNSSCSMANCKAVTGAIIATKVNWWLQNHHTGQGKMVGYAAKYAANSFAEYDNYQDEFREFMHTIGHWASTKQVLNLLGIRGIQDPRADHGDVDVAVSEDVTIRISTSPAGTHKHAVALAGIRRLLNHPVGQFVNIGTDAIVIARACARIKRNPASYHIGAKYLTGGNRADFNDADAGIVLGRVGTFLSAFFGKTSLASSPHIKKGETTVYKEYEDFSADFERICAAYKDMMSKADAVMAKKMESLTTAGGIASFSPKDTIRILDSISRGDDAGATTSTGGVTPATGAGSQLARFAASQAKASRESPSKRQKTVEEAVAFMLTTPAADMSDESYDTALSLEIDAQQQSKGRDLTEDERNQVVAIFRTAHPRRSARGHKEPERYGKQ
jgi:hypothetical protein